MGSSVGDLLPLLNLLGGKPSPSRNDGQENSQDAPVQSNATTDGQLPLSGLDGTDGFVLNGATSGDNTGRSVSSAGDFNGDGFDDFLISAPNASNNGVVYLVFGDDGGFDPFIQLTNLDGSDGFRLIGEGSGDQLGRGPSGVSAAGDVNDDGFGDIILGAPAADDNNGAAYVVFGSDQSFGPSLSLATLDGSDGVVLFGSNDAFAGFSVSGAVDFDGDGIDDLVVGAPYASPDGRNGAGEAYLVYGSDEGFNASLSLSNLDGSDGVIFEGEASGDRMGFSVAGIGDIDGSGPGDIDQDGFQDLILGAPTRDANAGEAYVVYGSDEDFTDSFNLSDLTDETGFSFKGLETNDYVGYAVAGAGDVDADGFADLVFGAPGFDPGSGSFTGAAYLFIGRPNSFAEGTALDNLGGKRLIRLDGIADDDLAGLTVASAGDVNGDGYHDIVIGAINADPDGQSNAGEAYVIFGRGDDNFPPELDLANLDGSNGFALSGATPNDLAGYGVSSAGDIDDDGFDDLLIGAPGVNASKGAAYAVYGSPDFVPGLTKYGNEKDNTLNGDSGPDVILGLRGGDEINGRGGDDDLYGSFGADELIGGGGNDKLMGGQGKDELTGDGGDDALFGNSGPDLLDGGPGHDILNGGTGEDLLKGGEGNDKLEGSADDDSLNGGTGDDLLLGSRGDDLLIGGSGNDVLNGGNDDDTLNGGPGKDELTGGEGHDTLNGGPGGDIMRGSVGDDTFVVGQSGDQVIEKSGKGHDLVKASISYSLGGHLEDLTLIGKGDINGTGNSFANVITGNGGDNKLNGKGGNDSLFGGDGEDELFGGAGKDFLDGGKDDDEMSGGNGNDSYVVDNSKDEIFESSGGGTDLVTSSVSYSLSAHIEKLTLTGNGAIDATGNNQKNVIKGNNNANKIDGGPGNDVMTGRGGKDLFVIGKNNGKDLVTDFKSGQDQIDVTALGFTSGTQVLNNAENSGGDVLIEFSDGNSLRLKKVKKNDLKSGDFKVKDNDGPPDKIDLPPAKDKSLGIQDLTIEGSDLDLGSLGTPGGGTSLQSYSLSIDPQLETASLLDFAAPDGIG